MADVQKESTLQGPNLALFRDVCDATAQPVTACGGISSLADLEALQELLADGVEGAIVSSALYEQRFALEAALVLTRAGS